MVQLQGIKVGEWWKDRLDCRQWGAHFPHVAGIAGQSNAGAQSVVLSGGCVDVQPHNCLVSLPFFGGILMCRPWRCILVSLYRCVCSCIVISLTTGGFRYEDDRDEGEWFLYTGSGGRDLSGNKRTNKVQSFDQKFESMNAALKVSCVKGLPVRVVRSFKVRKGAMQCDSTHF